MDSSSFSPQLSSVLGRLDRLINWEMRERPSEFRTLSPIEDLLSRLGNPHLRYRVVHVTGTKGKGSICALIEASLSGAGVKVGRYSSPHVERHTERITFDCSEISEDKLASVLDKALNARDMAVEDATAGQGSSWFDVLTAAAFLAFAEQGIEWAVVEAGLGGTLDSTNVIDGEIAVITNVDLEHTEILGDTRKAIAEDKIGILKARATLVTGIPFDDEVSDVLTAKANSLGCSVHISAFDRAKTIEENNRHLAGAVLDCLGERSVVTKRALADHSVGSAVGAWLLNGCKISARLPGRMEIFDFRWEETDRSPETLAQSLRVVLEGAHVGSNLAAVLNDLSKRSDLKGECIVVFGLGRDKNPREMLRVLKSRSHRAIFTTWSSGSPTFSPSELVRIATEIGLSAESCGDPNQALLRSVQLASSAGWILVTGSLHLVGKLRPLVRSRGRPVL